MPAGDDEGMRVLVVEDHATLAGRIAQGLAQAGMAADAVHDGAAALDAAAQTDYDVIVLDRDLPVVHDHVIGRQRGGVQRRRAVVHGVHGHPGLTQPLSDPVGKRRVVLDHQHPHPASMRGAT